jgi:hypothetical protein
LAKKYCAPFYWIIRCEDAFIPRRTSGLAAAGSASKNSASTDVVLSRWRSPLIQFQHERQGKQGEGRNSRKVNPNIGFCLRSLHGPGGLTMIKQREWSIKASWIIRAHVGDDIGQCAMTNGQELYAKHMAGVKAPKWAKATERSSVMAGVIPTGRLLASVWGRLICINSA